MPISLDEFDKLPAEKPARAKVPTSELLEFLGEQACSTKEVSAFLNVQTGTAFKRKLFNFEDGRKSPFSLFRPKQLVL